MTWFNVGAAAVTVVGGIAAKNKAKKEAEKKAQEQAAAAGGQVAGPPIPVDNIGLWGGKATMTRDASRPETEANFDYQEYLNRNKDVQGVNYGGGQWADDPKTQAWEHFKEARSLGDMRGFVQNETTTPNAMPTNFMGGGGFRPQAAGGSQTQGMFEQYMGQQMPAQPQPQAPAPNMGMVPGAQQQMPGGLLGGMKQGGPNTTGQEQWPGQFQGVPNPNMNGSATHGAQNRSFWTQQ